jgi:hypothetical protein
MHGMAGVVLVVYVVLFTAGLERNGIAVLMSSFGTRVNIPIVSRVPIECLFVIAHFQIQLLQD